MSYELFPLTFEPLNLEPLNLEPLNHEPLNPASRAEVVLTAQRRRKPMNRESLNL